MSLFKNRSSRREEALISLKNEPRYLGCYTVLKELQRLSNYGEFATIKTLEFEGIKNRLGLKP
jgi:hypothetical protein